MKITLKKLLAAAWALAFVAGFASFAHATSIATTVDPHREGEDSSGYFTTTTGVKTPEIWVGTSNGEVKLTADIATLNTLGAGTARVVPVTASTLTVTNPLHAGRTILQNAAAGCAVTLPAATGSGDVYRINVKTTITSVGLVISASPGTDVFLGKAWAFSDNAAQAVIAWHPAATDNTITLNGTTTGGYLGDEITIRDVAAGVWEVQMYIKQTGTEATPFSHV